MKHEVCSLTQMLSIAEQTLDLLNQKRNIINGQSDGQLSERQKVIEEKLLIDMDYKILALDSKFVNMYEKFFKFNHFKALSENDKDVIIKLQSIIPRIENLRE